MCLWKYKLEGYNKEDGLYVHEGLIYGENFTEAVDNIENWYGNSISNIYLESVGEESQPYLLNEQYKINEKEVAE